MASMIEDIMGQLQGGGLDEISGALGVDSGTGASLIQQALPALLGGLSTNAASPSGATALLGALPKHQGALPQTGLLNSIDLDDGQKIVNHVLGDRQDAVANHLMGDKSSLMKQLLPMLAPLVLNWLANRGDGMDAGGLGGLLGGEASAARSGMPDLGGLFDLIGGGGGSIDAGSLGGLLGGSQATSGSGGGLMGMLKKILGGK